MSDMQVGSMVGNRYSLVDKLGEGGMSTVWLARDTTLERLVAVKEVKKSSNDAVYQADIDKMRAEAMIMRNLDHPNIARVYDIIDENGSLYIVMEYVSGKDLAKTMRENREARGGGYYAYPAEDVIDWGVQLCEALGYLHTQNPPVIYRDMKPANVMLKDDGVVKIIDFGIAREFKPNQSLDTTPLGTRGYASPEAAESASQTDARSDVYSLGVTLFHLVTGHSPMEYVKQPNLPPIRSINPALSPALEQTIIRATQWDPNLRQQSMMELAYELENPVEPEDYLRMRNILSRFKGLLIAGVTCMVLGIGCLVASRIVRSNGTAGLMERAATASKEAGDDGVSDAERLYLQVIDIDPSNIKPYMALVTDVYRNDAVFTDEEATRWKDLYNQHERDLRRSDQYVDLCYEVGVNYFVHMDYSDELQRGSKAVEWFDRVTNAYGLEEGQSVDDIEGLNVEQRNQLRTAAIYSYMGNFESYLDMQLKEGNEQAAYEEYFDGLEDLMRTEALNASTMVQLRLYDMASRAFDDNSKLSGFRRAGISVERMKDLLKQAYDGAVALDVKDDDSEILTDLSHDIIDNYEKRLQKIDDNANSVGARNAGTSSASADEEAGS